MQFPRCSGSKGFLESRMKTSLPFGVIRVAGRIDSTCMYPSGTLEGWDLDRRSGQAEGSTGRASRLGCRSCACSAPCRFLLWSHELVAFHLPRRLAFPKVPLCFWPPLTSLPLTSVFVKIHGHPSLMCPLLLVSGCCSFSLHPSPGIS